MESKRSKKFAQPKIDYKHFSFGQITWPRERDSEYSDRWLHSLLEPLTHSISEQRKSNTTNFTTEEREEKTSELPALNGINREKAIKIGEMDQLARL